MQTILFEKLPHHTKYDPNKNAGEKYHKTEYIAAYIWHIDLSLTKCPLTCFSL